MEASIPEYTPSRYPHRPSGDPQDIEEAAVLLMKAERPGDIRPALERALKANREGKPAAVDFIVDGWDFAPGFKNFYDRLG